MREVVTYVAFDGEEFSSIARCRAYEQKYWNAFIEIRDAYTFYNAKGDIISIPVYDIETLISDLEAAYQESVKIVVLHDVSYTAMKLLYNVTGVVLPGDAGVYQYDFDHGYVWESVSE